MTGSNAANQLAEQADVILAVGTRLQDFTTVSRTLFEQNGTKLIQLNAAPFDAIKHYAQALICDAQVGLECLTQGLGTWQASSNWLQQAQQAAAQWNNYYEQVTSATEAPITQTGLPSDAQVLGAIKRTGQTSDIIVCAAGVYPESCINCGVLINPMVITLNTVTPAWAMKSPEV